MGTAIYTEDVPLARGTYNRHLNAIAPPPPAATRLWLVLDADDDVPAEQSDTNNQSSQAFTNAVVFTSAKYDGDAAPNVIGRFFAGIQVNEAGNVAPAEVHVQPLLELADRAHRAVGLEQLLLGQRERIAGHGMSPLVVRGWKRTS